MIRENVYKGFCDKLDIYTIDGLIYDDFQIKEIFLINNEINIKFNISHDNEYVKQILEKQDNIYNWCIALQKSETYVIKYIFGMDLISGYVFE